jgi:hypothetical protein
MLHASDDDVARVLGVLIGLTAVGLWRLLG